MEFTEALRMMASPYRRRLLFTLLDHNPEDEYAIPETMAEETDTQFEQLVTEMYHNHLPLLENAGVIDWDENEKTIKKGPRFQELVPLLTLVYDHQDELPDGWLDL